jgi:peptidoglycan L-alanyl-D-glutamate endopeptidase CwlK
MIFDERTERNIKTLHPIAQKKAREFMQLIVPMMGKSGITARIISGLRTFAEQDILYAKGRSTPGPRVTSAKGGFSNHNYGTAWDVGLFNGKQYLDESPFYKECGAAGKSLGIEWGGDWQSFKDEPHFQVPTGLSLAQMRQRVKEGKDIFA